MAHSFFFLSSFSSGSEVYLGQSHSGSQAYLGNAGHEAGIHHEWDAVRVPCTYAHLGAI